MVDPQAARQQLDLRLERLRALTFAELKLLPPVRIEDIPFGRETWSLTTYRDIDQGGLRIVVQIGPPQPKFVLVHVQADGFRIRPDGMVAQLGERELQEFK